MRLLFFCGKKEFYHEKEVRLWNKFHSKNKVLLYTENNSIIKRKFYYEKKALKGRGILYLTRKLYCGKTNSIMRKKHYHGRGNSIMPRKFYCGKRVLL